MSRSFKHLSGLHTSMCSRVVVRVQWVVLALSGSCFALPLPVSAQVEAAARPEASIKSNEVVAVISVDEVERGQRGYGLSVFEGTTVERFEVEVVGVLRNLDADTSFIMARLSGHGLERDGVSRGMSGSPVYIDGRLAGAVAFSYDFAKDALAGITPIEAMHRLGALPTEPALSWTPELRPRSVAPELEAGVSPETWRDGALGSQRSERFPIQALFDARPDLGLLERELTRLEARPRAGAASGVQVSLAGFSDSTRNWLGRHVAGLAQSGRDDGIATDLEAGSAVAGLLIDGDLLAAVSGTVTEREGERVLAFGHPYLGIGAVSMPMASAEVVTVVSSTASSFKLTNVGPTVGAFDQDRSAGIRGRIGAAARTVPFSIEIEDTVGVNSRYDMELADLPLIAPSLVAMSMLQSLQAAAYVEGVQSVELEATIELEGHEPLTVAQHYEGQASAMSATIYMLVLTGYLVNNPFEQVRVKSYDVRVRRSPGVHQAVLLGAHPDRATVRPGDTVRLTLDLRSYRAEHFRKTIEVQIPKDQKPGPYYVFVGDGATIDSARLQLAPREERSLEQALQLLRSFRSRDRLVALGFSPARGLIDDGEPLPQLPDSIRSLWAAAPGPPAKPLTMVIESETDLAFDRPLDGVARVDLRVIASRDTP